MESRLSGEQGLDHTNVIENARCRSVADHGFNIFGGDSIDHRLHRVSGGRGINQIHVVPVFDCDSSGGSQPLRVIESSTLSDGRATLLARKTRVKWRIQKQNTHYGGSISKGCGNKGFSLSYQGAKVGSFQRAATGRR